MSWQKQLSAKLPWLCAIAFAFVAGQYFVDDEAGEPSRQPAAANSPVRPDQVRLMVDAGALTLLPDASLHLDQLPRLEGRGGANPADSKADLDAGASR